jgi:hypothetical protein
VDLVKTIISPSRIEAVHLVGQAKGRQSNKTTIGDICDKVAHI